MATSTLPSSEVSFDAIVLGAGVAAFAAAIRLSMEGARVVVVGLPDAQSRLETLHPEATHWLARHDIDAGTPLDQLIAWWGTADPQRQDTSGARIVEHGELVAKLAKQATTLGAVVVPACAPSTLGRTGNLWRVDLPERVITAPSAVDASGRRRHLGLRLGARSSTAHDIFCAYWAVETTCEVGTWTEATPSGWWNLSSVGAKGGLGLFAAVSAMRLLKRRHFSLELEAPNLRALVGREIGQPTIWPCGSSRLCPSAGPGWIAVGDAAMTVEPLASAGVLRAFRDADLLIKDLHDPRGTEERRRAEYSSYLTALSRQYALETRWPDEVFWSAHRRAHDILATARPHTPVAT